MLPPEPKVAVIVRLPQTLYHELRVLLLDPRLGDRPRYGSLNATIVRAIRAHVEAQKVAR